MLPKLAGLLTNRCQTKNDLTSLMNRTDFIEISY